MRDPSGSRLALTRVIGEAATRHRQEVGGYQGNAISQAPMVARSKVFSFTVLAGVSRPSTPTVEVWMAGTRPARTEEETLLRQPPYPDRKPFTQRAGGMPLRHDNCLPFA
jgi:hypothetical protein